MRRRWIVPVVFLALGVVTSSRLDAEGCVRGRTLDTAGVAIAGASVTVAAAGKNFSQSTVSDAAGQFEVCSLEAGRYRVTADKASYQSAAREGEMTAGHDLSLTLELRSLKARAGQRGAERACAGQGSCAHPNFLGLGAVETTRSFQTG